MEAGTADPEPRIFRAEAPRTRGRGTADPRQRHRGPATRYGGAVDVERAADLYAQGWTLGQIGAELGIRLTLFRLPGSVDGLVGCRLRIGLSSVSR